MKIKIVLFIALFAFQFLTSAHGKAVRFIKDYSLSTSTELGSYKVGGLSGCAFDPQSKILWAISDDRSERGPARLYSLILETEKGFTVTPKAHLLLTDENGKSFPKRKIDFEALVLLENGNFLISSEGSGDIYPRLPPQIMLFNPQGRRLSTWELPSTLLPEARGDQTQGVRNNLAFESLTRIPDSTLFAFISEQALLQDGPETSNDTRSPSRFILAEADGTFAQGKVTKNYVYETDTFTEILGEPTAKGDSGISEALALNEREFLVLERSFFMAILKTRIRLFKASIEAQSTDVSNWKSLKGQTYRPLKKELLVDFNDFIPQLDNNYSSLDNVESMCWGPKLKNGKRSLILISDNNFNVFQRTQFILLETDF